MLKVIASFYQVRSNLLDRLYLYAAFFGSKPLPFYDKLVDTHNKITFV